MHARLSVGGPSRGAAVRIDMSTKPLRVEPAGILEGCLVHGHSGRTGQDLH